MEKYYEEWNGKEYTVRVLPFPESENVGNPVNVASMELWDAIGKDYENGDVPAIAIDDSILFYCDPEYFDSDPSDEDLVDYVIKHL